MSPFCDLYVSLTHLHWAVFSPVSSATESIWPSPWNLKMGGSLGSGRLSLAIRLQQQSQYGKAQSFHSSTMLIAARKRIRHEQQVSITERCWFHLPWTFGNMSYLFRYHRWCAWWAYASIQNYSAALPLFKLLVSVITTFQKFYQIWNFLNLKMANKMHVDLTKVCKPWIHTACNNQYILSSSLTNSQCHRNRQRYEGPEQRQCK